MPAPILGEPARLTARLVAALAAAERHPLVTAKLPSAPVAYCLGLDIDPATLKRDGRPELRMYGADLLSGRSAIYVGEAQRGDERAGRHRLNLASSRNLRPEDVWICWLEQPSVGAARFAEELLQTALSPAWCDPRLAGLGSKPQGRVRSGQRPSPWDAVGHQRSWAPRPTIAEELTAKLGAAAVLTRPEPVPRLWAPMSRRGQA